MSTESGKPRLSLQAILAEEKKRTYVVVFEAIVRLHFDGSHARECPILAPGQCRRGPSLHLGVVLGS